MESVQKRQNLFIVTASIIVLIGCALATPISKALSCQHQNTSETITKQATCTEDGEKEICCEDCGDIVEKVILPAKGHSWSEFEVLSEPSKNKNGEKVHRCLVCGEKEVEEIICPHEEEEVHIIKEPTCSESGKEMFVCKACGTDLRLMYLPETEHEKTKSVIIKEPTCVESGEEEVICEACGEVLETKTLLQVDHAFEDWEYITYATPTESGERSRICKHCGKVETETYELEMDENSIYIEGTDVSGELITGNISQEMIDATDAVYGNELLGCQSPWVVGKDTGVLSDLSSTKVGSKAYLSINGNVKTYDVVVSEFALQSKDGTDIVGQTSDVSIFKEYDTETLRMYTSSGENNGRWMVLATLAKEEVEENN